jgi:hypothetical protein
MNCRHCGASIVQFDIAMNDGGEFDWRHIDGFIACDQRRLGHRAPQVAEPTVEEGA